MLIKHILVIYRQSLRKVDHVSLATAVKHTVMIPFIKNTLAIYVDKHTLYMYVQLKKL